MCGSGWRVQFSRLVSVVAIVRSARCMLVIPATLAREPAARSRCIPPALAPLRHPALIPFAIQFRVPLQFLSNSIPGRRHREANRTFRRSTTRKVDFALPCSPSTWEHSAPPRPPTISWRRFQRDTFSETNPARIGCRSGLSRPDTHDHCIGLKAI